MVLGRNDRLKKILNKDFFSKSSSSGLRNFFFATKLKRILFYFTISAGVIVPIVFIFFFSHHSKAASLALSTSEIKAGAYQANQIDTVTNDDIRLQKGDIGSWVNQDTTPLNVPETVYYPEMQYGPNNTLYLLPGNKTGIFKRYWIDEKRWEDLKTLPFANFSKSTFDGSRYLYVIANTSRYFYRYDIYTDNWEKLPDTPLDLMTGSTMAYAKVGGTSYVYTLRGGNTGYFWRYNLSTNAWEELPSLSTLVTAGSDLTWDGGSFLYLIRGGGTYRLYTYNLGTSLLTDKGYFYSAIYDYYDRSRFLNIGSNQFLSFGSSGQFSKYSASNNQFAWLSSPQYFTRESMAMAYDGNGKVYFISGYVSGQTNLRVYDTGLDQWDPQPNGSGGTRSSIRVNSYLDDYMAYAFDGTEWLYVLRGSQAEFYKVSVITGQILGLPTMTGVMTESTFGRMVISGGKIYVTRGGADNRFFSYDLTTNQWEINPDDLTADLLPRTPASIYAGSELVDGGDGYLYLTRGYNTANFYRFNLSTRTWDNNFGGTGNPSLNAPGNIYVGGGMVKVGNALYVTAGQSNTPVGTDVSGRLFRYDLTTKIWSEEKIAVESAATNYGRLTTDGVSKVYFIPAMSNTTTDIEMSRRFYSYDVSSKQWKRLADAPNYARGVNSTPYLLYRRDGNTNQEYVQALLGGFDNRIWSWSPTTQAYASSGTYYSKRLDLGQVNSIDDLNYTVSGAGTAKVYTRTSDNLGTWGNWYEVINNRVTVDPGAKRYLQFKVDLTGNGSSTPIVSGFGIDWSQETDAPAQPGLVRAYPQKGDTSLMDSLISGTGHPYHHPYFTWNPASDGIGGSGVDGYYVYFGDNPSADPQTDGSYIKGTDYTADTPMTYGDSKVYYFRIKVKDKLGNISTAETRFSYIYQFVSPPGKTTVATQNDFAEGTTTGVDISASGGAATLVHKTNGSWVDGDLAKLPQAFVGGAAAYGNGSVYTVMGNNTKYFYRFDLSANWWVRLFDLPDNSPASSAGSVLCFDGDIIYYIQGSNSAAFYEYIISKNKWFRLNDLPTLAADQASMAKIGDNTFILSLMYSQVNFIYKAPVDDKGNPDISGASGTFSENESLAPGNFAASSNFYSNGNGNVYTMTEDDWLRSYNIGSGRWDTLGQAPARLVDSQNISFDGIGDNIYFFGMANSRRQNAFRYSITDDRFYEITPPNIEPYTTSYVVSDKSRYIYIFYNNRDNIKDNIFIKYDTQEDRYIPNIYTPQRSYTFDHPTWSSANIGTETSWAFYSGDASSEVYDGVDRVYFKNTGVIGEYSVSQQKLIREFRNPLPGYGHIALSGDYLYMTISNGSNRFMRLNIKTTEWEELANTPATLNLVYSQNMVADSSGRIYVFRGGNTTTYYRYTISSNTWETLASAPTAVDNGLTQIYDGSRYIYVVFGYRSNIFRRFDTQTSTWDTTVLSSLPVIADYGASGFLNQAQNKIYLTRGANTKTVMIYDLAANTWSYGLDTPTEVYRNAAFLMVNNDFALLYPAGGKAAVWRYNFPSSTNNFNAYGVYQPKTMSINGVFSYVNIEASVNLPANTSIEFQTRTSQVGGFDDKDWTAWQQTSNLKINGSRNKIVTHIESPVQKNLQVRAILQSFDSFYAPTLYDMAFNYYDDTNPPTNPTTAKVYQDASKAQELAGNTWYSNGTPFIDWPDPGQSGGSTDGLVGSNISGYYVYFGHDENAVPSTAGVFVDKSQYSPTLTDPGLYYLRIQTVDGSKNLASDIYQAFTYEFDNEKPTAPKVVSVDPGGFTNVNNFSFNWPAATDRFSGILQYCWHIGTDVSSPYYTERCQPELNIINIPAGSSDKDKQGPNTVYVRSRDLAGNYSDAMTQATFYYYNSGSPAAPSNLTVSPPKNSTNSFTFTWDPPAQYVGNVDRVAYYYSINQIPTAENAIRIESRSLGPIPAATQLGSNVLYLVAKDEAGNINWNMRASVNFEAATYAPGIPLNFDVNDISSQATAKYALALTWDEPANDAGLTDHYVVYRSMDGNRFSKIGTTKDNYYVDNSLQEGKQYYYQVSASDDIGKEGGRNPSIDTGIAGTPAGQYITPPEIVGLTAGEDLNIPGLPAIPSNVVGNNPIVLQTGSKTATVVWKTNRATSGYVVYGTGGNLSDSKGNLEASELHVVTLNGLTPNTSYSYRVQNFDQNHKYDFSKTISSNIYTFTTKSMPVIQNVTIDDITLNSARLTFYANGLESYQIQYGKDIKYGLYKNGEASAGDSSYSVILDKLDDSSEYNFKISIKTIDKDSLSSDNYNFKTINYPKITNIRVQPEEGDNNSFVVSWKTNVEATTTAAYQLNADVKEETQSEYKIDHSITIKGLANNAEYLITPKGKDRFGNTVIGGIQKVKTGIDTRPPAISKLKVEALLNSNNDKAQLIVSWETDEPSTSQVEFGKVESGKEKDYPITTSQDNNLTTKHTVVIPDLEPATTYHARVASYDRSGNISRSEDTLAVVGKREITVIQVILNVIANAFNWIKIGRF